MRQIIWIGLALAMLTSCDNRSNMNCEGTICPLGLEETIEQDSVEGDADLEPDCRDDTLQKFTPSSEKQRVIDL